MLASYLSDLTELVSELDKSFEDLLPWLENILLLIFLEVDPDGDADRSCATLPEHNPAPIWPPEDQTLVQRHRFVNRVSVFKHASFDLAFGLG